MTQSPNYLTLSNRDVRNKVTQIILEKPKFTTSVLNVLFKVNFVI